MKKGSRAEAGFSILSSGRVIKGWPDAWRPTSLYGQIQGSNDLVNQRLVGEIHLDKFDVSHTKDDILWLDNQEDETERLLLEHCGDYREFAKSYRKYMDDERGPSNIEVDVAVKEIIEELESPEMVDKIRITDVPPVEVFSKTKEKIVENVTKKSKETFKVKSGGLIITVYISYDLSISDPYVLVESTRDEEVLVIINPMHPHWKMLKASEGVANYLRHCIYDAVSEWKARKMTAPIDSDSIKMFKDALLRVSLEIEKHIIESL